MTSPRFSRRQFLGGAGVAAAGAIVGGSVIGVASADDSVSQSAETVDFHGAHQAGITTAQQDRLCMAAFDVTTSRREEVAALMKEWTDAARKMCGGKPVGSGSTSSTPDSPPDDTGEAEDLHPSRLTMTVGFGPTFFSRDGVDRFGVEAKQPPALQPLPAFARDSLDPSKSNGDIVVQACADDPQVAFHAIRNLARIGRGSVVMRWSQLGFGRTATTSRSQGTPRNLMGLKDGTNNIRSEDKGLLDDHVWVPRGDGPEWMVDGTYMVIRRIRMLIETWDRASLADQEATIGRNKHSGAPIGKKDESDAVDLEARNGDGPVIARDAHIRLAAPSTNDGARILRRGYSFTDGTTDLGQLDAGLFFIAFVRDPRTHFVPIQRKLSASDALNEYISHTSSGVFAIPPGLTSATYWGQDLLT